MGVLEQAEGGQQAPLRERHLVGRSRACALRLRHRRVSGEHAVLSWVDNGWWVRDLNSSNGTWVNGARLGEARVALNAGDALHFGSSACAWVLRADDAPTAFAVEEGPGRTVRAEGGMLELPGDPAPVVVHRLSNGSWVAEGPSGLTLVEDQQKVVVGPATWQVNLPDVLPRTHVEETTHLHDLKLSFEVSRDEEHIYLVATTRQGATLDLGSRAHHALLLNLARVRRADAERVELGPSEHGWVGKSRLARMLGEDDNMVHTYIHRARKQLARAGVPDAVDLIERRLGPGDLRIGVASLAIERA